MFYFSKMNELSILNPVYITRFFEIIYLIIRVPEKSNK